MGRFLSPYWLSFHAPTHIRHTYVGKSSSNPAVTVFMYIPFPVGEVGKITIPSKKFVNFVSPEIATTDEAVPKFILKLPSPIWEITIDPLLAYVGIIFIGGNHGPD